MLMNKNISYWDISTYILTQLPRKLYRYRSFNSYWKNNIYKGEVRLSFPEYYNDPFDSKIVYDKNFLKNLSFFKEGNHERAEEIYFSIRKKGENVLRKSMQVACFSEVKDSILMWSHYSASHTGYCIEYDTNKLDNCIRRLFLPVLYQRSNEIIYNKKMLDNPNLRFTPIVLKSDIWSYEKEWRIFATSDFFNNRNCLNFSEAICGIYIGEQCMDSCTINEIAEWGIRNNIAVYQMKMDETDYKLLPLKIT